MNEFIAYGFANTNRSDTEPENTLAYKQLDVFNADNSETVKKTVKELAESGYTIIYITEKARATSTSSLYRSK